MGFPALAAVWFGAALAGGVQEGGDFVALLQHSVGAEQALAGPRTTMDTSELDDLKEYFMELSGASPAPAPPEAEEPAPREAMPADPSSIPATPPPAELINSLLAGKGKGAGEQQLREKEAAFAGILQLAAQKADHDRHELEAEVGKARGEAKAWAEAAKTAARERDLLKAGHGSSEELIRLRELAKRLEAEKQQMSKRIEETAGGSEVSKWKNIAKSLVSEREQMWKDVQKIVAERDRLRKQVKSNHSDGGKKSEPALQAGGKKAGLKAANEGLQREVDKYKGLAGAARQMLEKLSKEHEQLKATHESNMKALMGEVAKWKQVAMHAAGEKAQVLQGVKKFLEHVPGALQSIKGARARPAPPPAAAPPPMPPVAMGY